MSAFFQTPPRLGNFDTVNALAPGIIRYMSGWERLSVPTQTCTV